MMLNAWSQPLDFSIPEPLRTIGWQVEIDTADPHRHRPPRRPIGRRLTDRPLGHGASRHTARELIPQAGFRSDARGGERVLGVRQCPISVALRHGTL